MNSRRESLLRPIHEYYVVAVRSGCVILYLLIPDHLMLIKSVAFALAGISFYRVIYRYYQGRAVSKYQSSLWRYEKSLLPRNKLENSSDGVLLGHGFEWTPKHTQRFYSLARKPEYANPPGWYLYGKKLKTRYRKKPYMKSIVKVLDSESKLNPFRPSEPPGDQGNVSIHAVGMPEGYVPIYFPDAQRKAHCGLIGSTGVGKSTQMALMLRQDITLGNVTIVMDPKSDVQLASACFTEHVKAGDKGAFHFIHFGFPEASSAYNPIGDFSRITQVATTISEWLPGEGQSRSFKEFVWRYVNACAQAINTVGDKMTVKDIGKYGLDIDPLAVRYFEYYLNKVNHRGGLWKKDIEDTLRSSRGSRNTARKDVLVEYFEKYDINDDLAANLIYYVKYDRSHLEKLIGSLLPLIGKLTTGLAGNLLSPDYMDKKRKILNWTELFRTGGTVYIGFDSLTDAEVASAIASGMFSDMTSTYGEIYKHTDPEKMRPISVYGDEVGELLGASLIQILNKGRGANVRLTLGFQTIQDLDVGFGDVNMTQKAIGNLNSLISYRAQNTDTAKLLTEKAGEAEVSHGTSVSTARIPGDRTGASLFDSTFENRQTTTSVDTITVSMMTKLPPGESIAMLNGGRFYKMKTPIIVDDKTYKDMPTLVRAIQSYQNQIEIPASINSVPVSVWAPNAQSVEQKISSYSDVPVTVNTPANRGA